MTMEIGTLYHDSAFANGVLFVRCLGHAQPLAQLLLYFYWNYWSFKQNETLECVITVNMCILYSNHLSYHNYV